MGEIGGKDIQLKGFWPHLFFPVVAMAGPLLDLSLREYLVSEAMHCVGHSPQTRALAAVMSGELVPA